MATDDAQPHCRVVFVGTGRKATHKLLFWAMYEGERTWHQRLATEMEDVCNEMLQRGLHLTQVVPVQKSSEFTGGWTEGAWLYFATR